MIYTDEQISALRSTSIAGLLATLGYDTRHTSRGMFFSPFRQERTPSFQINDDKHWWVDYGDDGHKYDVIDLLRRLKGYTFTQALDYLAGYQPTAAVEEVIKASRFITGNPITVNSASRPVRSQKLRDYALNVRHISPAVFEKYCFQVEYSCDVIDKETGEVRPCQFRAIGFPNRNNGWVLRNTSRKMSTASGFTLVRTDGSFDTAEEPSSLADTVILFEGFMDFLSWLELVGRVTPENADVIVLNSVNNVDRAMGIIKRYRFVESFLDNDAAGQTCTRKVMDAVAEASTAEEPHICTDRRSLFAPCNDVNEFWMRGFSPKEAKRDSVPEAPAQASSVRYRR